MIHTYIGYKANLRSDNIGTVQTPSQTNFYNSYIHILFGKIVECHSYRSFKEGWLYFLYKTLIGSDKIYDMLLCNLLTIDTDTVAKIHDMRRSIQSSFIAGTRQD